MISRKSLLMLALLCLVSLAFAQKKPITHDVYDDWKSIARLSSAMMVFGQAIASHHKLVMLH